MNFVHTALVQKKTQAKYTLRVHFVFQSCERIKGKTIIIGNHQRTRQLGAKTLDIHHPFGKKRQQDNYIQRLLSGKYSSSVSSKQHSNKTIVDNIKTTQQKRTST